MIDETRAAEGSQPGAAGMAGWLRLSGYGEVILSNLLWATIWIIVKYMTLPVPVMLFYRALFATTILALIFTSRRQWYQLAPKHDRLWLIGVVAALPVAWITGFVAVSLNPVILAVLIYNTAPVFTVIFAGLILRERTEAAVVAALPVSLVGVLLLLLPNQQDFTIQTTVIGAVAAIMAAAGQALQVVFMKRAGRSYPALGIIFYSCILAMILMGPITFSQAVEITPRDIILMAVLGAMNTVAAYGIYIHGLRSVKAQHAAILGYIEPAFATLLAILIFGERLSAYTLVGGALIFFSGYYVIRKQRSTLQKAQP